MTSIALALALFLGAEANPVNVWTGAAPSGSCKGNRVVVTTTGIVYSCVTGTWAQKMEQAVATPTFSPVAGTYSGTTQTVTIADATGGSTIYYTTNGTDPTTSSSTYSIPISVTSGTTVKAVAALAGYATSSIGSATYTLNSPAKNAVLYAPFNVPGCYASGSTALAVDGGGNPVAMTFTRASTAYYADLPGTLGAGWWSSCSGGSLRVSGDWVGALIEPTTAQNFNTPTDSPTSSGNWALIAAGPTVTANAVAWMDGTTTATSFTESAGVVSGIQQTLTLSATQYTLSGWFNFTSSPRQCWGFAANNTVLAKFDIQSGSVTYTGTGVTAGVSEHSGYWVRPWAAWTASAGSQPVQMFATSACTDSTMAATGGTAITYIARVMFAATTATGSTSFPSSYVAASATRNEDLASFPVSLADGNVCLSAKIEPFGSPLTQRVNAPIIVGFGGATTAFAANSITLFEQSGGNYFCDVYDNAGAVREVKFSGPTSLAGQAHVVKCCTTAAGTVSLGYDGAVSTAYTGAGTGILGTPPSVVYLGTFASAGGNNVSPLAISDVAVCGTSAAGNPNLCGDWAIPSQKANIAIGDSLTVGVQGSMTTTPWTTTASSLSGTNIAQVARPGWRSYHGLAAWLADPAHRYRKVSVMIGINDLGDSQPAGVIFSYLKQLYQNIISLGATPLPMTILPCANYTAAQNKERLNVNAAILAWCAQTGYACADSATYMDDGSYGGTLGQLRAIWDSGDHIHINQAGEYALGTFMAPYFN